MNQKTDRQRGTTLLIGMIASSLCLAITIVGIGGCDQNAQPGPSQPAPRTPSKAPIDEAAPNDAVGPASAGGAASTDQPADRPDSGVTHAPSAVAPDGMQSPPATSAPPQTPAQTQASSPPAPSEDAGDARFAGLSGPKPATWQFHAPPASSTMRVAEYSVPGVGGADQAQIVVYQFPGGGTFESNVARWKDQFKRDDGAPVEAKMHDVEATDLKIDVAEFSGEYRGMGKSEFAKEQTLIAAMIETDGNPVFVQLVGPTQTVSANREDFLAMLRGMKKYEPMK